MITLPGYNHKTTQYAEYKNYGDSPQPTKRISWSNQLTDEEAKRFSLKNVFGNWNPLK